MRDSTLHRVPATCTAMAGQRLHLLLLVAVWCWSYQGEAFTPNRFAEYITRFGGGGGVSYTHKDITKEAILEVTRDLLLDNPNPDPDIDSTARIKTLTSLTDEELFKAYYYNSIASRLKVHEHKSAYNDAIEMINMANEKVDTGEENSVAAAHFDSEAFQAGQNRLILLRSQITTAIQNCDYVTARQLTGRMLHTLQDFYSHSNWIEMGRRVPYTVLGKPGQRPENIAPPEMVTCLDCQKHGNVGFLFGLGINFKLGQVAEYYYRCTNNIANDVNENGILTSGYYTGQVDDNAQEIFKPTGKCSHGGPGDPSSDLLATGGINKDSLGLNWSPHGNLHNEAASVAQQASADLLQEIRSSVDDDTKFAAFLNIELTVTTVASIAYVIDTTASMADEIPEIQNTIPDIRSSLEKFIEELGGNAEVNFILVPFNDPGIVWSVIPTLNSQ